jgi:2-hydroxy-3-keto-5-methylthiopentenyl-1-phosphate phosphatase
MGMYRNCLNIVFRRGSRRDNDGNIPSDSTKEAIAKEESNETASSARNEEVTKETISSVNANGEVSSTLSSVKKDKTIEDIAAIKIQASFRGHLVVIPFHLIPFHFNSYK